MQYVDVKKRNPVFDFNFALNRKIAELKREIAMWDKRNKETLTLGRYNNLIQKLKTELERVEKMAEVTHIYADGLFVDIKEINDDFKIIKLGINYEKFTEFLSKYVNSKGYVNIDLKPSKKGGLYAELNTYGMKTDNQQIMSFEETEEVPF